MNKIAMLLTATLIAGAVTMKFADLSELPASDPLQETVQTQRIDSQLTRYERFKEVFEANLESLEKGNVSLKDAVARVVASAQQDNPDFLGHLKREEPGATDAERMANNLVGHMRSIDDYDSNLAARVKALEKELAMWE